MPDQNNLWFSNFSFLRCLHSVAGEQSFEESETSGAVPAAQGPAVSMPDAEDLPREVLTRKSNEIDWICGPGHEKSILKSLVEVPGAQKNGHGHYL